MFGMVSETSARLNVSRAFSTNWPNRRAGIPSRSAGRRTCRSPSRGTRCARAEALAGLGVSYLTVGWPSQGKARLDEFVESVMPDVRSLEPSSS